MAGDAHRALGAFLTAFEAERLAVALEAGYTTGQLLGEVHQGRRTEVRRLMAESNVGPHRVAESVSILRAIAGARSVQTRITPVWTMPGSEATAGRLTSEVRRLIDEARMSVVCSSFNFAPQSRMWSALLEASNRPDVSVTVYLDGRVGRSSDVAAHLPRATVYRTLSLPETRKSLVSHAKFVIIDRTLTLVTSANFSYPAEHSNIELGLLVHDTALAESIESLMRDKHGVLYERVTGGDSASNEG